MKNVLPCQQRMLQLSSHQPVLWPGWWALRDSSMETNGWAIAKPSATADTPSGASWGDSGWKRIRYWHWIAKVHKAQILASSATRKKLNSFMWDAWFSLIVSFWCSDSTWSLLQKLLYIQALLYIPYVFRTVSWSYLHRLCPKLKSSFYTPNKM